MGLYKELENCYPSIKRGKVWCKICRRKEKLDPAYSMRYGWPECCGETMTINHPDTWDKPIQT